MAVEGAGGTLIYEKPKPIAARPRAWRLARAFTALALVAGLLHPTAAAAGDPVCHTSGPGGATDYTTTVCITVPGPGDTVSGEQTVTATTSTTHSRRTITEVVFRLGDEYLITDFDAPFTFVLPSDRWADGMKDLKARAIMTGSGDPVSEDVVMPVNFSNGVTEPAPNTNQFTPRGEEPAEGESTVIGVVGDGASGANEASDVVELIASWDPNMFIQLGDVYERGSIAEFHNWYGTTDDWGTFRSITNPTPGNHEYETPGAAPYFHYWDNVPHFYSFEEQGWQLISLDSNSEYGQTVPGTDQYEWFEDQLADPNPCKIVFMHHPRFRPRAAQTVRLTHIWNLIAANGVDVVLVGHEHNYERWHPLNGLGEVVEEGPVQMVVGTGGHEVSAFALHDERMAFGVDTVPDAYGALRVELSKDTFDYEYVNTQVETLDSGSISCAAPDTEAPTSPLLIGQADDTPSVHLDWSESNDNVGVVAYDVYRDDVKIASTAELSSIDVFVEPGAEYDYYVVARDAADNVSVASNVATVTVPEPPPPPAPPLFEDGFEMGDLSKWSLVGGLTVQSAQSIEGEYAARARSKSRPSYANAKLRVAEKDLYFRTWFKIRGKSGHPVTLGRFMTRRADVASLYLTADDRLGLRNSVTDRVGYGRKPVARRQWHEVVVHLVVNGTSSEATVWLDGVKMPKLSHTGSLGNAAIKRLQLGERTRGRNRYFHILFDDVLADDEVIATSS